MRSFQTFLKENKHTSHIEEKGSGLTGHRNNGFFSIYNTLNQIHSNVVNGQDKKKAKYDDKQQKEFHDHINKAAKVHDSFDDRTYDSIDRHSITLKMYINKALKQGLEPSTKGYQAYMAGSYQKELGKLGGDKNKLLIKKEAASQKMADIHNDKDHIQKVLDVHKHLQNAKDILYSAMDSDKDSAPSLQGYLIKDTDGDTLRLAQRHARKKADGAKNGR